MSVLIQYDKYGSTNTRDYTTMNYYVIQFVSETYTLQEGTTCDVQISTSGGLVFKAQYLNFMQEKIKWYWE